MSTAPISIGPYRIIEALGSGAQGEVYLASDSRLGRKVAIKTLSTLYGKELDEVRGWVLREARAAARLNHPHIAAVYDVLESPEGAHIVMEYVRGETLAVRLRVGPLAPGQVLEIAIQLADALAEAHASGVVHRDLKPANVVITPRGDVKVLDFGVAQIRPIEPGTVSSSSLDVTLDGRRVGTPPYMPPEHLLGDPVDARGDIYSLGVMLYELLTGVRPFRGASTGELTRAILEQSTPRARAANRAVPEALDAIVYRAMAREPRERYASAAAMAEELRRVAGHRSAGAAEDTGLSSTRSQAAWPARARAGRRDVVVGAVVLAILTTAGLALRSRLQPVSEAPRSLAVLPLKNLSSDPEGDYFSDGITEDIIAQLSKVPDLKVVTATAAVAYRRDEKSAAQVGRELAVRAVLVGSVRRSGNRVRIVGQLVDVAGHDLWAETYDRDLGDIFAIQADVARRIASALDAKLSPAERERLQPRGRADPEAFNLYLRGRYHWNRRTPESLKKGVEYFSGAIERDPAYAAAYAGLADSYSVLGAYRALPWEDALPRARAAAEKAIEIDDGLGDGYASLALVKHLELDWTGAEAAYRRAIQLRPGYATAHHWYANYLVQVGRSQEAIAEIERAQALDPLSASINATVGGILYMARQYERARVQLQTALAMDPGFAPAHKTLADVYAQQRNIAAALAEARKIVADAETPAMLGYIQAVGGQADLARRIAAELEAAGPAASSPTSLAFVYAGLGERDLAFRCLESAYATHDILVAYVKVEPKLDNIRDDPRYDAFLRKVGFPEK